MGIKYKNKEAVNFWDNYRHNLIRATPLMRETIAEKENRIKLLLSDAEKFYKYYFPSYIDSEAAGFQKRASKRLIKNRVWFEVRAWARDHAKSARAMMEVIYLKCIGESKNILYVSHTKDNADELLMPVMIQLESNQRLINDFGLQRGYVKWEMGKFITADGCSFRAIGAGQSPRGTRNEAARPDTIIVDDIDEDELCRNEARVKDRFDWMMGALFASFDIKGNKRFLVIGNIIAKKSIVTMAAKVADYFDKINIFDKKGKPSWKERYSFEECMYMINKLGYRLAQREYFNNPILEGSIFKDIQDKKILPLHKYNYLVCYTDPSWKSGKKNDSKSTVLIGSTDTEYHVIKSFCEITSIKKMVGWNYDIHEYVNDKKSVFFYMEASFMQDLLLDEFTKEGEDRGWQLPITGDTRKKPDKFQRVEALEPYFSRGQWFFNFSEKDNPHMQRLKEQFQLFQRGSRAPDDGPDACEGCVWMLNKLGGHLAWSPKTKKRNSNSQGRLKSKSGNQSRLR